MKLTIKKNENYYTKKNRPNYTHAIYDTTLCFLLI